MGVDLGTPKPDEESEEIKKPKKPRGLFKKK